MLKKRLMALLLLVVAPLVVTGVGCAENAAATAKCKGEKDSDKCQTCCKSNGANGYKFINNDCGCLGG